ncbi:uncharacterized protein [Paramormyrops kingsleyae]|uniref:uncharacterized protein n=1 Tax=Paramormyrops kingsleyae TaxID=1676925 RepID=UPI003B975EDE
MRLLVVLVLAVLTGCQAKEPHLEDVASAFWDYVAKATHTAKETLQMIRESQLGQEVNDRITGSADVVSQYTMLLRSQLTPVAQDMLIKMLKEAEVLKDSLMSDINTAKITLEPYAEELRAKIQQQVEKLKQEVASYADSLDTEALKTTLLQKSEELKVSLDENMKELQTKLGPYTDELREKVDQRLQEFKDNVAPLAENIQSQMVQRAKTVQQSLAPYAEDLREKLDPYAQDLRTQLSSLWESFTKKLVPSCSTSLVEMRHREPQSQHRKRLLNTSMKVFVVLALAVFSGCHANILWADEPKPQLEKVTDAFWEYVAKATQTTEETLKMIRESQLGQAVNAKITESADVANQYTVALRGQLTPLAEDTLTQIFKQAEVLRERLAEDVSTAKGKLEPYTDELKAKIQERVEQLKGGIAPYADSLDTEALKTTLLQKSEELKASLDENVKELQTKLGPYTEEFREKVDQRLQEFKDNVAPLAENIQSQMMQRAKTVQQSLAPYAEDLREKLDPYAQDLKTKLSSLWESFISSS